MKVCEGLGCVEIITKKWTRFCDSCAKRRHYESIRKSQQSKERKLYQKKYNKRYIKELRSTNKGREQLRKWNDNKLSTTNGLERYVDNLAEYIFKKEEYIFEKEQFNDFKYTPYINQDGSVWREPNQNSCFMYYPDAKENIKGSYEEPVNLYDGMSDFEKKLIERIKNLV